jgi:hypothetical protein
MDEGIGLAAHKDEGDSVVQRMMETEKWTG